MIDRPSVFRHHLRVRYSEVDLQGIVYNAHYLTFFDIGVHEFLRSLPYDYTAIGRRTGLDFNMVKGLVNYHRPLRLDEDFAVEVSISRVGQSSLTYDLGIRDGDEAEPRTTGEIVSVSALPSR